MITVKSAISYSFFTVVLFYSVSVITAENSTKYTPTELLALKQFRAAIPDIIAQDEYYDRDHLLIRWLRARRMDLGAAVRMIREANVWRMVNQIDSLANDTSTVLQFSTLPYFYQGNDKEGRPVVYFTPTHIDLRKLILSGKRDMAVRTWDQLLERGYQIVKNSKLVDGEEVTQIVGVFDFNGYNLRQHLCVQCLGVYIEMMYHYENYYPDALKHFVTINVNRIALRLVELLRPFLSEATQRSLKVFGTNRAEWSNFLLSIIPEDELPYRFGGPKTSNISLNSI